MEINIEKGTTADIGAIAQLYDDLNDYLSNTINYPGWIKGIYPIQENAARGVQSNTLYVAKQGNEIVGSFILNHEPEPSYHNANWGIDAAYSDIWVIRTFVVHPIYLKYGIGRKMMAFITQYGMQTNMKSIRLDVYEGNMPAIRLYEECGFKYIDSVDLGLGNYGLDWFKLYEKVL